MKRLWPIVSIMALGALTSSAVAKDPPPQSPLVSAIEACRAITDPTQRLACYDQSAERLVNAARTGDVAVVDKSEVQKARKSLFGFSVPRIPFFSGDDSADAVSDTLETTITKAWGVGYGRYRLIVAEGNAEWETTEAYATMREPRAGDKVIIKRGSLGSYVMRIGSNRGVKGKRVG